MAEENREGTADDRLHASMQEMIAGGMFPPLLYVAAKLGIADLLADGPQPIDALAAATGTQASGLSRVLRALASRGVFTQDAEHRVALTPARRVAAQQCPGLAPGDGGVFGVALAVAGVEPSARGGADGADRL